MEAAATLNPTARAADASLERAERLSSVRPLVHGYMPARLRSTLGSAYRVALERLRSQPSCSVLFASRGTVGFELLTRASFAPADPGRDQARCARRVAALAEVGGRQIRMCPRFEALSPVSAALVLIHETLHLAGMSEYPPDARAFTSAEINRLVEASCGR